MSTGDAEWEALIKTNNDEEHASLYDKWFMGEGVHQLTPGCMAPHSVREPFHWLRGKRVFKSFCFVIALFWCGVISVRWNRKLQEMSTNACILEANNDHCQSSQAKKSFTAFLCCSFIHLLKSYIWNSLFLVVDLYAFINFVLWTKVSWKSRRLICILTLTLTLTRFGT